MSNRSFSELPSQQRRERIAAVLAMGLARVPDQGQLVDRHLIALSFGEKPCHFRLKQIRLSIYTSRLKQSSKIQIERVPNRWKGHKAYVHENKIVERKE
jgi:hypothetical protein